MLRKIYVIRRNCDGGVVDRISDEKTAIQMIRAYNSEHKVYEEQLHFTIEYREGGEL